MKPVSRVVAAAALWTAAAAAAVPEFKHFSTLSLEDGLSQSTVYSIAQDARGFMWFGTEDGLNRFDGYQFTVYRADANDPASLGNNTVYALERARDGTLWIGTWGGGLARYLPGSDSFEAYRHDPANPRTLSHDMVFEIFEDSAGDLWVGTLGGGLNRFDPESGEFQRFPHDPDDPGSLSGDRVVSILEDSAGVLWVGTDGAGLNRLDRETGRFARYRSSDEPDSLSSDRVFALLEDRSGQLWVGTHGGGLNRMDRASGRFERFRHDPEDPRSLSSDQVLALHEDRAGRLWLGTGVIWTGAFGGGLNRLDPETREFSSYRADATRSSSLAADDLLSIYEDASGLLWLGTNGAGVSRFHPDRSGFPHFKNRPNDPSSLSDNAVYGMYQDADGVIWIGTWNGGLNRFDPATATFRHYRHDPSDPLSLPSDTVNAILEDSRRNLWIGTESGLTLMDRGRGRFRRIPLGQAPAGRSGGNEVQVILEDRQGALWLGTFSGGVVRLDPGTGEPTRYLHDPGDPDSLSNNNVYAALEDSRGDLWFGTEGGLDLLDRASDGFRHFRTDASRPDSLGSNDIMCIYESRAGELWVGTYGGGLNRLDRASGSVTRYTRRNGLPNDVVYGVLEDGSGRLWMSTNKGLSRFDPRQNAFRNFDVFDGLQSNEFDAWAFHKTADGRMLFGGINGFNWFDPDEIAVNPHMPPLALTSFKIFNREALAYGPAAELRRIEVPHGDRVLSFEFAALDYTAPQKNQYAYRLEGFDEGWVAAGTTRSVTYTNLDPGSYVLHVRGSNSDAVWSDEALAVQLVVVPPYWMTGWFRALAALAFVVVALGTYALRTRSVRRRSQALAEINRALNEEVAKRRRTQRELEISNRELEARNEELEVFTYSVSHDLKSPLVTILGFANLLERDAKAGDRERLAADLERIRSAATRMRQLLDELLELSKVGRLRSPPEAVDLRELAAEAVDQVAGPIADAGVRVEIQQDLPEVFGERSRLLDVFQNLVGNAVKFIGDQPEPRVEIGGFVEGDEVVVFVRDNGRGIDPSHHQRVFKLFQRLETEIEGTGIGLAMVKRIVEVHGGRAWVESDGAGLGSTFFFALPRFQDAGLEPGPVPYPPVRAAR